jgi:hypothetical protein
MLYNEFFEIVYSLEKQRQNMISCFVCWKTSDTELNWEATRFVVS